MTLQLVHGWSDEARVVASVRLAHIEDYQAVLDSRVLSDF